LNDPAEWDIPFVVSTLAEIEAAIPALSAEELAELERFVRKQRGHLSGAPAKVSDNLWSGARERLRRLWGERTLSEAEVEGMRDYEDGE
jgi:hypothetical protein